MDATLAIFPDTRAAVASALRHHAGPDGFVLLSTLREQFPTDVLVAHLLPALAMVNADARGGA